ncbi:MAG TPA: alanine dehydrogenase, partial [Myxococcales bacterium]|nr:alanine dehydrogenase [Myxococcales bacterium]
EHDAGVGAGVNDAEFVRAGATVAKGASEVWERSDMIVKVKEPLPPEYDLIREGQIVYTYFHLAAVPELATLLLEKKVAAVAYETIQTDDGALPLLKPMSEVAGKMAIQVGAASLEREHGGKGLLLGGVPGVRRGRVAILGGGVVGTNAAKMAIGLGAEVNLLDINLDRLGYLDDIFLGRVTTLHSDTSQIERAVSEADLVIGAVLIPGARAPKLVPEALVAEMSEGSVVVDVAVDQGGCIETCKPTTHDNPTYVKHGVVHYCVANMPGAVSHTSTFALTNATLRYATLIADQGLAAAAGANRALALGVNAYDGHLTHEAVARSLGMPYRPLADALRGSEAKGASSRKAAAKARTKASEPAA